MALSTCPRCNKMFDKQNMPVCPRCEEAEQADYETIREALNEKPNLNAEQIAEETDVSMECVMRLVDEGRLETSNATTTVKCGRCGAPAISLSKKLCEACLGKLNAQMAKERSKISLPKRKNVDVGTALNVPDALENKKAGSHRKNLLNKR